MSHFYRSVCTTKEGQTKMKMIKLRALQFFRVAGSSTIIDEPFNSSVSHSSERLFSQLQQVENVYQYNIVPLSDHCTSELAVTVSKAVFWTKNLSLISHSSKGHTHTNNAALNIPLQLGSYPQPLQTILRPEITVVTLPLTLF